MRALKYGLSRGLYNYGGKRIGDNNLYPCIRLWWDGDLLAESYNDTKFEKWNWQTQKGRTSSFDVENNRQRRK